MPSMRKVGASPCCRSPMAARRTREVISVSSISVARLASPTRKVWRGSVTMRSPGRLICCGPTAMSRRASAIRREARSRRRWHAPAGLVEERIMALSTSSNFTKPDDAFRAVVEAHRGLSEGQSADLDAALVLILANHIGDLVVLREAIELAKRRMIDGSQQGQQQQQQ